MVIGGHQGALTENNGKKRDTVEPIIEDLVSKIVSELVSYVRTLQVKGKCTQRIYLVNNLWL